MTSFCEKHPNCTIIIATRVLVVIIFMVLGVVGNGTVLYIYRKISKKHPQAGKKTLYIRIMAWLDLFFCTVILAQMPLFEFRLIPDAVYFTQAVLSVFCYLLVQIAIVFDRIFAVFTQFKYAQNSNKCNRILCVVYVFAVITFEVIVLIEALSDVKLPQNVFMNGIAAVYVLAFFVPCVVYPAIAIKLWSRKRKIATIFAINQANSKANQIRAAHVKALRLYAAVLALFVIAYVPTSIGGLIDERRLHYLFMLNGIGNPVVYYMLNDEFRNEVKKLAQKLQMRRQKIIRQSFLGN